MDARAGRPTAAQRLEETDGRVEAVQTRLHQRQFRREQVALCVQLIQVARIAFAIASRGQLKCTRQNVAFLCERVELFSISDNCGQVIFDLAKRLQRRLAIGKGRFITLRSLKLADEQVSELTMLCGFDDDLAAQITQTSNRIRGLLTQIHFALERVLGPRLDRKRPVKSS